VASWGHDTRDIDGQIADRCSSLLAEAERQAQVLIADARQEADRITAEARAHEFDLVKAVGERVAEMGDAYLRAMARARQVVQELAEISRSPEHALDLRDQEADSPREACVETPAPSQVSVLDQIRS
jgi:cell division septum initiation protein DivIVA